MTATVRALWLVVNTAIRVNPVQSLLGLAQTAGRTLTALNPLFYGLFAAGAAEHNGNRMLVAVVGLVGTTAVQLTLQMIGQAARIKLLDQVGFTFSMRVSTILASIETIDHQESPELLDKLQMFRDYSGILGQALNTLMDFLNTIAWAVAALAVAVTADWRLIILALLGIPRLFFTRWTTRWDRAVEEEGSQHNRRAIALLDLSRDVAAGAEIRIFRLQDELRRRLRESISRWQRPAIHYTTNYAILDLTNGLIYFGSATAIIGWMVHDALRGSVSVQALIIAITTLGTLQGISGNIVNTVKFTAQAIRSAKRFVWLQQYADKIHDQYNGDRHPPKRLHDGIRVDHLSYRYHGTDRDALDDVTLDLPAGSVVAIVGENGAGKSTLVKLLTGMYAPTTGQICIDGIPLHTIDLAAWRERCSGAFQDHVNFEFTVREAVGVGDHLHISDANYIDHAIHEGAADEVITSLPDHFETQLGTTWPNGVDISGGQWQRLSIARGMMRRTPLLLVLDEPTSALDAGTEHALFERYTAAAHEARRQGAVTLLITHRFSTVAAADLVIVLADGRITEIGTHAQLMSLDREYAALYEMQASGYR